MKFILPMQAVVNAQKCIAKGDPRYYLEGFHVTQKSVEATNGHYLYQAKLKEFEYPDYINELKLELDLPESMIIRMKQEIKKPVLKHGCDFVVFDITDKKVIATTINQFGEDIGVYLGEVVDGRFPDLDRVIPTGDPECHSQVGFNSAYLRKIDQVTEGKFSSVKLKSYGENKAAVFEIQGFNQYYEAIFVLMPIRL